LRKKEFQTTREKTNSTMQNKKKDLLTINKTDIELFGFFRFIGKGQINGSSAEKLDFLIKFGY
jgi:serine kinase of HPr protein (carbohydrate metabolism regulator)